MKREYLLFAIFTDGGNIASHSKVHSSELDPESEDFAQEVVDSLVKTGMEKKLIHEIFAFGSNDNKNSAPETVQSWTTDDGFFGEEDDEDPATDEGAAEDTDDDEDPPSDSFSDDEEDDDDE